ncbi:hypothetical protein HY627_01045 [Candidatus Uhrbacteria bacterium]|nr:hypothetical protein [Candidatus Uhrbacteria bacterium]
MKYFIIAVVGIVTIGIIAAFFAIGSPSVQRDRRFDMMRVQHLQMMQSEILRYWQSKGALPIGTAQLKDDISGFQVPADPETGAPYEYSTMGQNAFQLCANFSRQNEDGARRPFPMMTKPMMPPGAYPKGPFGDYGDVWHHAAGRVCFDRTIDKDLYPIVPSDQKGRKF